MGNGIAGLILAGGRSSRMGGQDKALLPLAGRPLLDHVLARLRPQVGPLALSSNSDPATFAGRGLPLLADMLPDRPGPLAGVLAGLLWSRDLGADWLLSVPVDTPFLPTDLAKRLLAARPAGAAVPVLAATESGLQPTIALWPVALAEALAEALAAGQRRVGGWALDVGGQRCLFPGQDDAFANLNTPADLAAASARLAAVPGGAG